MSMTLIYTKCKNPKCKMFGKLVSRRVLIYDNKNDFKKGEFTTICRYCKEEGRVRIKIRKNK